MPGNRQNVVYYRVGNFFLAHWRAVCQIGEGIPGTEYKIGKDIIIRKKENYTFWKRQVLLCGWDGKQKRVFLEDEHTLAYLRASLRKAVYVMIRNLDLYYRSQLKITHRHRHRNFYFRNLTVLVVGVFRINRSAKKITDMVKWEMILTLKIGMDYQQFDNRKE